MTPLQQVSGHRQPAESGAHDEDLHRAGSLIAAQAT